jgi:hypothetical protein
MMKKTVKTMNAEATPRVCRFPRCLAAPTFCGFGEPPLERESVKFHHANDD